ncbi:hypothetical protein BHE74_00014494 [Ensete ventricosum]|nr:hypothetical protein BHE74_00014494 [Ensete ventricosum]
MGVVLFAGCVVWRSDMYSEGYSIVILMRCRVCGVWLVIQTFDALSMKTKTKEGGDHGGSGGQSIPVVRTGTGGRLDADGCAGPAGTVRSRAQREGKGTADVTPPGRRAVVPRGGPARALPGRPGVASQHRRVPSSWSSRQPHSAAPVAAYAPPTRGKYLKRAVSNDQNTPHVTPLPSLRIAKQEYIGHQRVPINLFGLTTIVLAPSPTCLSAAYILPAPSPSPFHI